MNRPSCLTAVWRYPDAEENIDRIRGLCCGNLHDWDIYWLSNDGTPIEVLGLDDFEREVSVEHEEL